MDVLTAKSKTRLESRTYSVDDLGAILGIGRSSAYILARRAEATKDPFIAIRIGNTIRISKRSLEEYLESVGL